MGHFFNQLKTLTMEEKIVIFGKWNALKNLLFFVFELVVGFIFQSWVLIAISLYDLCLNFVKICCANGLKNQNDTIYECKIYIRGGFILAVSSAIYLTFSILNLIYPSTFEYNQTIGVIIAIFSFFNIIIAVYGLTKSKGKNMLTKEYKISNFAKAITGLYLTQMAILSMFVSNYTIKYNAIFGVCISGLILFLGIYIIVDGKERRY